jgi:hypothetical protein
VPRRYTAPPASRPATAWALLKWPWGYEDVSGETTDWLRASFSRDAVTNDGGRMRTSPVRACRRRQRRVATHRPVARICSAGHGGQVLVSAAAYDSLGGAVLTGLTFRHLGEHSLKDLRERERLFQLLIAGVHNAWSRCCAARQTSSPRP